MWHEFTNRIVIKPLYRSHSSPLLRCWQPKDAPRPGQVLFVNFGPWAHLGLQGPSWDLWFSGPLKPLLGPFTYEATETTSQAFQAPSVLRALSPLGPICRPFVPITGHKDPFTSPLGPLMGPLGPFRSHQGPRILIILSSHKLNLSRSQLLSELGVQT